MNELEKEFELLLIDYEDGSISDEDFNKMQQLMKEHEELRVMYVRYQMIEATVNKSKLQEINIADFERMPRTKDVNKLPIQILSFAAAALLGIAFFLTWTNQPATEAASIAVLEDHRNQVEVIRNGKAIPLTPAMQLHANDTIRTTNKVVGFTYHKESTLIIVRENSELQIQETEQGKRLLLKKGDILCDVDKQPIGKPMTIITEQAKVTVLGTQFLLSSNQEDTEIHVSEGSVQFEEKDSNKMIETKAGWRAKTIGGKGGKIIPG